MKQLPLPSGWLLAGMTVFAALVTLVSPSASGEPPGPGLEIIDGIGMGDGAAVPYPDTPPEPIGAVPYNPALDPAATEEDILSSWGDPYTLETADDWSDPFAQPADGSGWDDPFAPAPGDDGAAWDDDALPPLTEQPDPGAPYAPATVFPADPYLAAVRNINTRNYKFPGIGEAAARDDLRAVADIVWQVLRERRVVDATLTRGPGASAGTANPYDVEVALAAISYQPVDPENETPVQAAARILTIVNAFEQPVIDDYSIGAAMEQALIRLNSDIYAVREAMAFPMDDGTFIALTNAYIRAATTCDFFLFPRRELAGTIRNAMRRTADLFYPDGASVAGDVAGVTGGLFRSLLLLDHFTRDDSWFRRDIGSVWRTLERPARYVLGLAMPDQSLPRFGPRGAEELWPMEVAALASLFPPPAFRMNRIGLAASHSFPDRSTDKNYGGIFALRSGPEPNARYLAMRFGPPGDLRGVPAHCDFGSMVLMAHSIKFIVDPGGYDGPAAGPAVHSGLSLDGQYIVPTTTNVPGSPVESVWRTNASIDYLTDKAAFADGKTWQRSLLYVKDLPGESRSDYWLVLDHVDMQNDPEPRQARIRYQLAPGIQAMHDGAGIVATASYLDGPALRIFAIDQNAELTVSEGDFGLFPSHIYDAAGGAYAAPAVTLTRTLVGDTTTLSLLYPGANHTHRPVRIERDSDIIRGRTGAVIIDHGDDKIDVIAWAPPGTELVTPTLNLQLAADLAVFRLRHGRIARIDFVNLERFQAKEPEGGLWSLRVNGPAQTLTIEPERGGGWQVLADPANRGGATFYDVNFGPALVRRKFSIRPGEMRVLPR